MGWLKALGIDFTPPTQEEMTPWTWARLTQLGMATEEFEKAMEEKPEPDDIQEYTSIAVEEAEYASRPWWQKIF